MYWKIAFMIALAIAVNIFNANISPLITADQAVGQLEDSHTAYLAFQTSQRITYISISVYVLIGLLVFRKNIKNLFKGE